MKESIVRTIISHTCMCFTFLAAITVLFKLLSQNNITFCINALITVGTLFLLNFLTIYLLPKFNFRRENTYSILFYATWYLGMGLLIFGTGFMGFRMQNILIYTLIMFAALGISNYYNTQRNKMISDEINELLSSQNK